MHSIFTLRTSIHHIYDDFFCRKRGCNKAYNQSKYMSTDGSVNTKEYYFECKKKSKLTRKSFENATN